MATIELTPECIESARIAADMMAKRTNQKEGSVVAAQKMAVEFQAGLEAIKSRMTIHTIPEEDGTMSTPQITQKMLDQAMALVQQEKAAAAQVSQMAEPKLPLAVRMAVGLANAVTGTENLARNAKGSVKGFAAQFKAAYVANRPVVTPTMPKDVSPEELAAALAKIQQESK